MRFFLLLFSVSFVVISERPKRQKSVSAETEISAKLTESSAEISAETLHYISWKWGLTFKKKFFNILAYLKIEIAMNISFDQQIDKVWN